MRTDRARNAVAGLWLLRLVTAAALAVDAYVHADLAPGYDFAGRGISQGDLFLVEAAAAALAALLLILLGTRPLVWAYALLVALAGTGAVLLYRYVDVGALGPLRNMYEPVWYPEKTLSAVAEAAAVVTALCGLALTRRWRNARTRDPGQGSSTGVKGRRSSSS
ncbi:hypothetical protein [Streptacidiphilus albus]|uniref:hypothetical protein n=1 Tax=Streptacidiphilus albus TaxID=105425 RepID=UPI0005A6C099|nr:hypothetical protein [Streptacidiphilus albus]